VRELQNLIERAVIRWDSGVLPNPLPDTNRNYKALGCPTRYTAGSRTSSDFGLVFW
jgi:hypothetical protein